MRQGKKRGTESKFVAKEEPEWMKGPTSRNTSELGRSVLGENTGSSYG